MFMPSVRRRIDRIFERVAAVSFDHPRRIIMVVVVMVVALASQLPQLRLDTSNESFLHQHDPILTTYEDFKDNFGMDQLIILAIEPQEVFDLQFLSKLKQLHKQLVDQLPHLDDITSLVNARNTRGEEDHLIVEDLLETFPQNHSDLAALRERVMSNPLYRNRLISSDGRMTAIVLETDTQVSTGEGNDVLAGFEEPMESNAAVISRREAARIEDAIITVTIKKVEEIIALYRADDFKIHLSGTPVVGEALKKAMLRDMARFLGVAILTIGFCLFMIFRRVSGPFLALTIVILALVSTIGLMAWWGVAFNTPHIILPSFLLAVGVGAAVHVLALVYYHFDGHGQKRSAVVYALGHSGLAILMTSLTTAAGLFSFATSELAPVAFLGLYAGIGVLMSFFYTVVLLPALVSLLPLKHLPREKGRRRHVLLDRVLDRITRFSTRYAQSITVISLLLMAVALFSAVQLRFSQNMLQWLPPEWPTRQATETIDRVMGGTINLEVLVDTGRENGLYDPAVLKGMDGLARRIEAFEESAVPIGKASSLSDIVKEIHQALNANRALFYRIPDQPELIPQELLLFENSGSDDLEDVCDSQFRTARFTVQVPWVDILNYVPLIGNVEQIFRETLGDKASITSTGMMAIFSKTLTAAIHSMAQGYVLAGVTITLMMLLLVGRIRMGLISMIPNLTPVTVAMGLMYWWGMPLDTFTMLVGAIALGLAVDDTVHFLHNFRRYYAESNDAREAVRQTLHTAGRAMLVTSVILAAGFFLFMFASMHNVVRFGFLTGLTILLALVADFITVPALLVLIHPPSKQHPLTGEIHD